ncbi:glycosyltransferase family 2 protein [Planctomyces sp. SH-PL14]|uniref:glycosyltransferase family 2 protein n=1 Tax=Planctomyces sp. SH-PL14 TaxID=1632864 RepID=UPI00078EDF12|nr:glycosyltransferase family 2 protein [Planctomyces sp. SH-PL14]AMV20285.1 Poly-beta-1,6-N-acetyl-D-glucosamine synthase [Planctomyces sp. SH-PL14]
MLWESLYWGSLAGVVYLFAGYPALLLVLGRLRPFRAAKAPWSESVTVIAVGHNEAHRWPAKIDSILATRGSDQIAQILIGSDGSTDDTVARLSAHPDPRVRVVHFDQRRGKPATLNDVIPLAASEVVILTDARQRLDSEAIAKLTENFADPRVGVVSGELVFETSSTDSTAARGIGLYWVYEKLIRKAESRFRSVPGATGALYALRKSLFRPIPPNTLLDDVVIPMQAVEQGTRCLFEPGAIAWDRPSQEAGQEAVRKRRTIAGAAQLVLNQPRWLLPWKNPIWWEFCSHKIGRLLSPVLLVLVLVANAMLLDRWMYRGLFAAQLAFYGLAGVGYLLQRAGMRSRLCGACLMFVSLNTTTVAALWDAVRGRFQATWQKTT